MDWFNAVVATYRQQLRELNDLNWERFRAELHAAIAQSEARLTERMGRLDVRLTEKFSDTKADILKWMFIYWSGTVLSVGGLILALLRK